MCVIFWVDLEKENKNLTLVLNENFALILLQVLNVYLKYMSNT